MLEKSQFVFSAIFLSYLLLSMSSITFIEWVLPMLATLKQIIAHKEIQTLFQPICNNEERQILGYEALTRGPSDSLLHSPIELFRTAEIENMQVELEMLCVEMAMQRFTERMLPGKLFVNLSPSVLLATGVEPLVKLAERFHLSPSLVVIELTENHPAASSHAIVEIVSSVKQHGFMVAIDDLGAGNSGLKLWSELRPDFVKLDIYFSSNIDTDATKKQFVTSLKELAEKLGCHMILEGVERKEEFLVANEIGIRHCQGYLFGKPSAHPTTVHEQLFIEPNQVTDTSLLPLRDLLIQVPSLSPTIHGAQAMELFIAHPEFHCIPILDQDVIPIGVLRKNTLVSLFAQPFGHSLYAKAPLTKLMDLPVCVDINQTLFEVSQQLIDNEEQEELDSWFIITQDHKYQGMGRLRDLVRKITNYKLTLAQHANPLTHLPGNMLIQCAIESALREQQPFIIAYCDLNDFKPYNDICGYERGDMMIKLVARLLQQYFDKASNFIGHLGGDDFIVLLKQSDWIEPFKELQTEFRRQRLHYYRNEDLMNNGIWGKDRDGHSRKFSLVDLSIGVMPYTPELSLTLGQISSTLSIAKHRAKGTPGHLYCLDNQRFDFATVVQKPNCISALCL